MCAIALIGAKRDEFCDMAELQSLYLRLPATPWLRLVDTDHFFTESLPDLATACREAIRWIDQSHSTSGT